MGRDYSVIKTNVGNDVRDASATTLSIIGRYINKRYMQILRAMNWQYINEDYLVTLSNGTQDYTLPTDFKNEVYALNTTDERNLERVNMQELANSYPGSISDTGAVYRYTIFDKDDGTKQIRFHYVPDKTVLVKIPYYVWPAELSDNTDEPIMGLEDLIEVGATADAWRYKREFAKASDLEILFNQKLEQYIWKETNQKNLVYQFTPQTFDRDDLI